VSGRTEDFTDVSRKVIRTARRLDGRNDHLMGESVGVRCERFGPIAPATCALNSAILPGGTAI
jgi:hypothetical protein